MKKTFLIISLASVLILCGSSLSSAQEQPKPKKDTVNIDTDAKPKFYYAVEDEKKEGDESGKSPAILIAIIAGAILVAGGIVYLLLRKKK
ncbi:MAG: hypothetical protein IQL11_05530 [Bacteroidales bacterium]|nr:hypothetical protein [Bacteroidales bacterium]